MPRFFRFPRLRARVRGPGIAFALMTLLSLLAAWNTGNQLLYIIFGGLVSFQVVSLVWVRVLGLRGLAVKRDAPHAVYKGEPFWVRVRVENNRALMPAFALRVERRDAPGAAAAFVRSLPAKAVAEVNVREVFERRGVYPVPPYSLTSGYPFGLSERTLPVRDRREILVYPRVHAVRAAVVEQFRSAGQAPISASGEGDEFFNLREYIVGDDLRRIAWKVSARRGTWIVREMVRERSRHVVFVLDTRRHAESEAFDQQFEDAIDIAASLAVSLLRRHYTVAMVSPEFSLEGGEGAAHEHRLLDALARVTPLPADTRFDASYAVRGLDVPWATVVEISPDPQAWGTGRSGGHRVLDPREVVYA